MASRKKKRSKRRSQQTAGRDDLIAARSLEKTPPSRRRGNGDCQPSPGFSASTFRGLLTHPGAHHLYTAAVVFALLMAAYVLTMPRVVTFEDSGLFNLVCYHAGVAHPPGYPLYSLLCYPFAHLPFVSTPFGVSLLSALLGALTCVLLYVIAVNLLGRAVYGCVAALSYGFSRLFWSQAIIQEVYTLNALLFFILVALALAYRRHAHPRHLSAMALVYGLALSNHWPLILLSSPALLLLMWPSLPALGRQLVQPLRLLALSGLLLLGLTPYLYLAVRSSMNPMVNFYAGMKDFSDFIYYVGRTGYSTVDDQGGGWEDKMQFAELLLTDAGVQYGLVLLPLIAAGFIYQWKRWHWSVGAALVLAYLMSSYLLVLLLNFKYSAFKSAVFGVYPMLAYGSFALWLAAGVEGVVRLGSCAGMLVRRPAVLRAVAAGLALAVVAGVAVANYPFNNRRDHRLAHEYAEVVLNSLEPDAVLITHADYQLPMMELNLVEGVRPDVTIYNRQGLILGNRFVSPTETSKKTKEKENIKFVEQETRPVYYFADFNHGYGVEDYGVYKKVRKDWEKGRRVFASNPKLLKFTEKLNAAGSLEHPWDSSFKAWARYWMLNALKLAGLDSEHARPYVESIRKGGMEGKIELLDRLLKNSERVNSERVFALVNELEQQIDENTPADIAWYLPYAKAIAQLQSPEGVAASSGKWPLIEQNLLKALEISPLAAIPAAFVLLDIYAKFQEKEKFIELRKRYKNIRAGMPHIEQYEKRISEQ